MGIDLNLSSKLLEIGESKAKDLSRRLRMWIWKLNGIVIHGVMREIVTG